MATANELDVIWQRTDDNSKRIQKLETGAAVTGKDIERLQRDVSSVNKEIASNHSEIKSLLSGYSAKVEQTLAGHHEGRGAARALKWAVATALGGALLVIGIMNLPV